jgi:epsilon-lactone hydrolase
LSLQNELVVRVGLPLYGLKRTLSSAERTRRRVASQAIRPPRFSPPRILGLHAEVSGGHRNGWPLYSLAPKDGAAPVRHVIYFHGGAYINEIAFAHWWMLGLLVRSAPCRAAVPIYPLAAAIGPAQTIATASEIAGSLAEEVGAEGLVLMGDSAGGGMALAVAQALRDGGVKPARVVLISPWLDLAVDLPEQQAIGPRDAMLGIPGLQEAGRTYAGGLPLDDPRLSPIHGDMSGLPPVTSFTGTDDVLNPDSHRLQAACERAGTEFELIEADGMPHVYPLLPTPEGRTARRQIIERLRSD